jgi:hypothetical protein
MPASTYRTLAANAPAGDLPQSGTTVLEHMPAANRAHLEWTPQRLIDRGSRIGVTTGDVVSRLL